MWPTSLLRGPTVGVRIAWVAGPREWKYTTACEWRVRVQKSEMCKTARVTAVTQVLKCRKKENKHLYERLVEYRLVVQARTSMAETTSISISIPRWSQSWEPRASWLEHDDGLFGSSSWFPHHSLEVRVDRVWTSVQWFFSLLSATATFFLRWKKKKKSHGTATERKYYKTTLFKPNTDNTVHAFIYIQSLGKPGKPHKAKVLGGAQAGVPLTAQPLHSGIVLLLFFFSPVKWNWIIFHSPLDR